MATPLRVQTDRAIQLNLIEQTDADVYETSGTAEELRFAASSGFIFPRNRIASRESRNDGKTRNGFPGRGQVDFALNNDFVIGAYNTIIANVQRANPVAALAKSDGTIAVSGDTITFSGASSLVTAGFKKGVPIYFTSGLAAADNNTNLIPIAVGASSIQVHRALTTVSAGATYALAQQKYIPQGAIDTAFTGEERRIGLDRSEVASWLRFGNYGLSFGPDQPVDFSCGGMGRQKFTIPGGSSPVFSSTTRAAGKGLYAPQARLYIVGVGFVRLSNFNFSFDNQLSREDSVEEVPYEIIPGQPVISATFTHIETNLDLEDDYLATTAQEGFLLIEGSVTSGLKPCASIWFSSFLLQNPGKSGAGADRSSTRTYTIDPDIDEAGGSTVESNILFGTSV